MKILITNDDSIHAPGIALLAEAAARFGEVWIVAPARECSAMSQKLTLRESMAVKRVEDFPAPVHAAYELDGTPVDCVKVALDYILPEKPDWVFSGINNGYNAGYDIAYSGTLGAAFEAARNGIPAMAFSVAADPHLPYTQPYLNDIIRELLEADLDRDMVWNVNFPALRTRPLMGILRDRFAAATSLYREKYVQTLQSDGTILLTCRGVPTADADIPAGSDARAVRDGYISIGKVRSAGR